MKKRIGAWLGRVGHVVRRLWLRVFVRAEPERRGLPAAGRRPPAAARREERAPAVDTAFDPAEAAEVSRAREREERVLWAKQQLAREAEERALREAEERALREAEERARREAEEQAREAEERALRKAEERARREAEERARREAEEQAREAEEQARREAEEQARREAEEQARREAEEQARREAEEQARWPALEQESTELVTRLAEAEILAEAAAPALFTGDSGAPLDAGGGPDGPSSARPAIEAQPQAAPSTPSEPPVALPAEAPLETPASAQAPAQPAVEPESAPAPARPRPDVEIPSDYVPAAESTHEMYQVAVDSFAGPLDLLLFLIRRHALDVFDIPIAFICERYLEHVRTMADLDLDLAAEFLAMAAELLHIKSKMLLPKPAEVEEEEEIDPRAELVRRLLEYQKYKDAAELLAGATRTGRDVFGRSPEEMPPPSEKAPLAEVSLFALIDAFDAVLKRHKPELRHQVMLEAASVRQRIRALAAVFAERHQVPFVELLGEMASRVDVVVTFLAILEMARLRLLKVYQSLEGEIYLEARFETIEQAHERLQGIDATLDREAPPPGEGVSGG